MNNQGNFPNIGMRPTMNQGQNIQQQQQQQQQQQMLMMEQLLNGGNTNPMMNMFQSNLQAMNSQQRVLFMENFQRNLMMMQQQSNLQSQGMMGPGNAGMMNMMQDAMWMQGNQIGSQQGLVGSRNPQQQIVQPAMQQLQMPVSQGGIQRPVMSQGHSQQQRVSNPAQEASVNRNPSVNTLNTRHQTSAVTSNQSALLGQPKLKGILKNPKSVSSNQSANVMPSQKQAFLISDQHDNMSKAYLKQSVEAVSVHCVEKQLPVTTTIPSTQTCPFQTSATVTSANEERNVMKPTTSQYIPTVITSSVTSKIASQTRSYTVSSQSQASKDGQIIPTLVSSGLRKQRDQPNKRKADVPVDTGTEIKKAKVVTKQVTVTQQDIDEEDPEHVQAQVFISNIPNYTTKEMILEILLHYKFTAPKVWIGQHNSVKNKICAFVKLPSLKDSKRVITEMNGFPYKGLEMEIRFSAAADFMDYTVPDSGLLQPQTTQQSPPQAPPVPILGIPPSAMLHPSLVEPVPVSMPVNPVAYATVPVPVYAGIPPVFPSPVGYGTIHPDGIYTEWDRQSLDSDNESPYPREYRRSVSPKHRLGHSPVYSPHRDRYHSPNDLRHERSSQGPSSERRYSRSPDYSSQQRYSGSPNYSSERRYSRSPDYSSLRRYSRSPECFSQRRYSRSPEYSLQRRYSGSPSYRLRNPDYQRDHSQSPHRRERSPDSYVSEGRVRDFYTQPRLRSPSPDYSAKERSGYGFENASLDDMRRDIDLSEYPVHGVSRSSLSPDGGYRDLPCRGRSHDYSPGVHDANTGRRDLTETYCIYIENLPADLKDDELELLLNGFAYDSLQFKVRDGKATANIYVRSSTEAKIMVRQLDARRFMGSKLRAEWHREEVTMDTDFRDQTSRVSDFRDQDVRSTSTDRGRLNRSSDREKSRRLSERNRSSRTPDRERREKSKDTGRSFTEGKEKSLFQSFINASYPNAPVLGRKYIKEFSCEGSTKAFYLCILCEVILTWKEIADHMMGYKHRLKCIKRSHPKIYDEICHVWNKVDMLGKCAKYALQLENTRERIARVHTPTPGITASKHLKSIKADRIREFEKKDDRKAEDKKSEDKKKGIDTPDSTSDIFKKIEAYKKKFEASKDTSVEIGETPAKKPRKEGRRTSSLSFEDLEKQNKSLADSIQKGISSARKGVERQTERSGYKKAQTNIFRMSKSAKRSMRRKLLANRIRMAEEERKAFEKKSQDYVYKKAGVVRKSTNLEARVQKQSKETKRISPKGTEDVTRQSKLLPEIEASTMVKKTLEKENSSESKDTAKYMSESKNAVCKEVDGLKKDAEVNENFVCKEIGGLKKDAEIIFIESDKEDSEESEQAKPGKNINENKEIGKDKNKNEGIAKEMDENKGAEKYKNKETTKIEKEKDKSKEVEKKNEETEDLTIDPDDIKDLGQSISAELFGEELGDMEDEEAMEEKLASVEGVISNHPRSMLKKFFDIQLLKDSDNSGIVGLQYITEVIPAKSLKGHTFLCSLCDVKCARSAIVDHIMGYKHRMKYFEVHHFDIYSNIMKLDQSRKFLNTECIKCAKLVQQKEGLKTIMTLSEADFKQKIREVNKEQKLEKKAVPEIIVEKKIGQKPRVTVKKKIEKTSLPLDEKKPETIEIIDLEENTNAEEVREKAEEPDKIKEIIKKATVRPNPGLGMKIREAKAAAKLVSHIDGRESVELYKYIQQKPDVPLLGLNGVTEIQGLYGSKFKTATYICQLCLPYTKIDSTPSIYEHLTGIKHMETYLKKHFPHKMIHLKLLTQQHSAKSAYLHNQAKLLCQPQLKQPESIYVVNMVQMEEEKKALELAQAGAKAVEEAARAEAEALAATKQPTVKAVDVKSKSSSTTEGVIDLTAEEVRYEPLVARLYTMLAGLQDIPLVGLSYITEIQGIMADKVPPRFECKLCDNELITANYINAHITGMDHRIRFLKANYPVFYSKAEGNRDLAEKFCREIEEQFGRESISVKKRILVRPDGSVVYSDPSVVKAPLESKESDVMETIEIDEVKIIKHEEGKKLGEDIFFYKMIEGLDCTPMLGLQYIKEVQHPSIDVPPVYECDVCNIKNGPYLNTKNILKHVCSKDHRLRFMRENHVHLYKEITSLSTERQQKVAMDKHTKEIESKVGRGTLTKVKSDKSTYWSKSNLEVNAKEPTVGETAEKNIEEEEENMVADEDQTQYRCNKCSMLVARERRREHIVCVHFMCYQCKQCQLSFPNHFYLQKHINTHHDTGNIVPEKKVDQNCNMNKWFTWHAVKGHPLQTDPTGKICLVCKQCQMVVKPEQAEEHNIYYHIKGYKCRVCKLHHGTNTALEKHLRLRHNITEEVQVENYRDRKKLSKKFIRVYSLKPPKLVKTDQRASMPSNQSEVQAGMIICTRCPSLFKKQLYAENHFKASHFFEYPCSMCKNVFRAAAQLEQHYSNSHRVYRSVKTPIVPFEKCFEVLTNDGIKMSLEEYIKQDPQKNVTDPGRFVAAAGGTAATDAAIRSVTSATSEEPVIVDIEVQQDKKHENDKGTTTTTLDAAKTAGAKTAGPPIYMDTLLVAKEDEQFDWATEYAKIKERMLLRGITLTARKSKFMMNYTSTFSNYPLIGLQMVTEFQQKDISALPWYMCALCEDRITWSGITAHIASFKHRIKYLEKHHTVLHSSIAHRQFTTLESLTAKVESLAQGVVTKEGKKFSMTVMIELPSTENVMKTLDAKTKTVHGPNIPGETSVQSFTLVDKGQACSTAALDKQQTCKEEKNKLEDPKKKLPTWIKIPRISTKVNQSKSATVVSPAKTKGYNNEKKVDKSDERKETATGQSKTSLYADSNKQREDRDSRSGARSSRRSPRRQEEERRSKETRISRSERRSKRHEKEGSSSRRRRSKSTDKDDRGSKSTRGGHDCSGRGREKDSDKKSSRDSSKTRNIKSDHDLKDKNKTGSKKSLSISVGEMPSVSKEMSSSSQKLPEAVTTEEIEHEINEDDFSLEELELIGKCIEKQMTEEAEWIHIDNDTEGNKTETKITHEISNIKEETKKDKTSNECKDAVVNRDETDFNVVTGETKQVNSKRKRAIDNCVVEMAMVGSAQAEKKTEHEFSKVYKTTESSSIESNMNLEKNDSSEVKSLEKEKVMLEPCVKSKPRDNTVRAEIQMANKTAQKPDINLQQKGMKDTEKENDRYTDTLEIYTETENKMIDVYKKEQKVSVPKDETKWQPSTAEGLSGENSSTDKRNMSNDDLTEEDNEANVMTDTYENDADADFEDFITYELGEDFITIDDFHGSPPDTATETERELISDTDVNMEISNKQGSLMQPVGTQNDSIIAQEDELSHENKKLDIDENKENRILSRRNSSDMKEKRDTTFDTLSEKKTEFDMEYECGSSKVSSNHHLSKSDERHDTSKQIVNTNRSQEIPNVCVVEVSMKPSSVNEKASFSKGTDEDDKFEPYDDSEDMEFILTDEFLTVDEHEENDTELKGTLLEKNLRKETEGAVSDMSIHSEHKLTYVPVDKDGSNESIISPKQKEVPIQLKLQLEDHAPAHKSHEIINEDLSKDDATEGISDEVITSFPMEDDEDDIEEIFLGGDFVTVDTINESKEETATCVMDTVEKECMVEDFFSEEFVTVDEVDADASVGQIKQINEEDNSENEKSHHKNKTAVKKHSPRNKDRRSLSRDSIKSTRSQERSFSRGGDRASKDKSDSKKSSHSSDSRVKDTKKQSSSKKVESSRDLKCQSLEKSTKSSSCHSPRESGMSSSSLKSPGSSRSSITGSGSSQREASISSMETESTGSTKKPSSTRSSGIEVNVQLLNKESGKEPTAWSISTRSSDYQGPYKVKQDGKPRNITACSFLGISIKPATESTEQKEPNKPATKSTEQKESNQPTTESTKQKESNKPSTESIKQKESSKAEHKEDSGAGTDINVKPDQNKELYISKAPSNFRTGKTSAEKKSQEPTTSAKTFSDNKHRESKSGKDRDRQNERTDKGRSRNKQFSGHKGWRDKKRPSKSERKGKQMDECEISIEIGLSDL